MEKFSKHKHQLIIIITFVVAVLLRILYITKVPTIQVYDFQTYYQLAKNIANGQGHTLDGIPIAWQGPAYSYVLSFIFRLTNNTSEEVAKYFNVIMSMATLYFGLKLYEKIFVRKKNIYLAIIITALFPNLIAYNNVIGTEPFFILIFTLLIYLLTSLVNGLYKDLVIGIICGVATLTKPFMLVYPFIIVVIYWVDKKNIMQIIKTFSITTTAMIVVMAPWTYRNYKLFGSVIPVSYNSGYVLFINNNDTNITGSWLNPLNVETDTKTSEIITKVLDNERNVKTAHELDEPLKQTSITWIKKNVIEFMKLGMLRFKNTFFAGANDLGQWTMNGYTLDYAIQNSTTTTTQHYNDMNFIQSVDYATQNLNKVTTQYYRNMNFIQSLFDIIILVFSSSAFILFFKNFIQYAKAVFLRNTKVDLFSNIIFINIAFFSTISFVFEGQARYNFPLIIVFIISFVKIFEALDKDGIIEA